MCACGVCGVCVHVVCVVCVCVCVHVYVCVCVCVCVCVSHVSGDSGVCVLKLLRYCDAMSCLPIVSDRAATEGSKYFELGRQPHEFLTRNTCFNSKYLFTSFFDTLITMCLSFSSFNLFRQHCTTYIHMCCGNEWYHAVFSIIELLLFCISNHCRDS